MIYERSTRGDDGFKSGSKMTTSAKTSQTDSCLSTAQTTALLSLLAMREHANIISMILKFKDC